MTKIRKKVSDKSRSETKLKADKQTENIDGLEEYIGVKTCQH